MIISLISNWLSSVKSSTSPPDDQNERGKVTVVFPRSNSLLRQSHVQLYDEGDIRSRRTPRHVERFDGQNDSNGALAVLISPHDWEYDIFECFNGSCTDRNCMLQSSQETD